MGMPIRLRWYSMQLNIHIKNAYKERSVSLLKYFQPMGEGWGRGWGGSAAQQIDKIGRIACQHQNAWQGLVSCFFWLRRAAAGFRARAATTVSTRKLGGKDNRRNQGGCAHHEENIEDIAAHNVTNGDVRPALPGSGDRGDQFRQRGAQGHDGQADEALAHSELFGQGGSGVHGHIAAPDHQS